MADDANALAQQPAPAAPAADGTAPVQPVAPVSGDTTPEVTTTEPVTPKMFDEAQVNKIVGERLARQKRQHDRELQQLRQQAQPQQPAAQPQPGASGEPQPEQFQTTQDYLGALAEFKARKIIAERDTVTRQEQAAQYAEQVHAQYQQREDVVRAALPDFDDVVYAPSSPWNSAHPAVAAMADAVKHFGRGPELAHYLAKNREEFTRVARLHPAVQGQELAKLEAKLSSPAPAISSAPTPIPAGRPNSTVPAYDTTDPRSTQGMSASQWIEADRARQRRLAEGRNR